MYAVYGDGSPIYSPDLISMGYALSEAKVTMELNKAGSFDLTMPPIHPAYSEIKKMKTIISIKDDGEEIWRGRAIDERKDFFNNKKFTCEGLLAFLNDVLYEPFNKEFSGTVQEALTNLLAIYSWNASSYRQIYPGKVYNLSDEQQTITAYSEEYIDCFSLLNSSILEPTGGYIIPVFPTGNETRLTLDFYGNLDDRISDQTIQFGKNLLDLEEYVNSTEVYTYLIPLGKKNKKGTKRTDITSVNDDQNYIFSPEGEELYGKIWKSIIWDEVDKPATLLSNAKKELEESIKMATTITIKAVDLRRLGIDVSRIKLGYHVPVVSFPHGLNANFLCSKIVLNLLDSSQDEYTLGFDFKTLTEQQSRTSKTVNSNVVNNSVTNSEIADLDARISALEGNNGGIIEDGD